MIASIYAALKFAPQELKRSNGCKPLRNRQALQLLECILAHRALIKINQQHLGEVSKDGDACRILFLTPRGLEVYEEYYDGAKRTVLNVPASRKIVRRHCLTPELLKTILEEMNSF